MKDVTFTLRLPTLTKNQLKNIADKKNISMAEQALQYIQKGLKSDIRKSSLQQTKQI